MTQRASQPAHLEPARSARHTQPMPRKPDNVVPFRKPRKWTRPEDFGHVPPPGPPKPPRPPKKPRGTRWLAWALIAAVVAATIAWSLWT